MRILTGLVLALLISAPAAAQVISPAEMLRSSVTNYIRPQTKAFATRTTELSKAMYVLCENGDLTGYFFEVFGNGGTIGAPEGAV